MVTASLPQGSSVVDLAAGSGAVCLWLKDIGMRPTGTDPVDENVRLRSEVDFFTTNLNDDLTPHPHRKFDCVLATELIEHLENPHHFNKTMPQIASPGGLIFLSTPNTESSISLAQFIRSGDFRWLAPLQYRNDGHLTPILLSVLRHALEESNFTDICFDLIAPLVFRGLAWWKMRLLAWMSGWISGRSAMEGDFLIARACKPR